MSTNYCPGTWLIAFVAPTDPIPLLPSTTVVVGRIRSVGYLRRSVAEAYATTFSRECKVRLVMLATNGERSVSQVAIDHQLNANVLRKWIRQADAPTVAPVPLVPVRVTDDPPARAATSRPCVLELTLHGATLRFFHGFDPVAVAQLLRAAR